ncbi:hypothetical protein RB195_015425 [Necator americanus]|uniref:Leishmanolysin-like peptidase n=1 Tax=Necator americanus TaxID=51031 RepID=A0ABR1E4Y0_NECAM
MLVSLLLTTLNTSPVFGCEHFPLSDENLTTAITEYPEGHRPKRDTPNWDWIRIETEYDQSFNLLSEEKQELLEDLITNARDYFETTIKVQRLSSIQLQPTCKGEGYIVNGHIECDYDCEKRCGKAIASPLAHYFTNCRCTKQDCETKQKNWGGKLRDADFVLFVLVSNERCTSMTLAYAAHCSLDKQTNRPVAGFVNVCPNAFNNMKSNDVTQWEATIKHELIHAFVFSTTLYTKYQGITRTSTKEGSMVLVPGVIERFKRVDWESAAGIVSHDVYMMVTPKVREEARKHFQCPDLEGAEIENQGGPATAGVHWEKRVFENEAMTGVATQVYALSRITLALFEDSGWYQVNYNKAEPMSWGHELGCKFAKQSCLTWMRTNPNNPYPFCTVVGDKRCSTNRRAKVTCNLMTDSMNVSSEYDYNVPNLYRDLDGHSVHGYGNLPTADYCPYYRVYGDFSSQDKGSDTRCTYPDNMNYNNYSLEIFSPTAQCFQLDGGIKIKHERGVRIWMHSTICKRNLLFIKTQNSKFYPCYHGGQLIHVEKRVYGVGTVTTRIICPSCTEMCGKKFCAPERIVAERIGDPTRGSNEPSEENVSIAFTEYPPEPRPKRSTPLWESIRIETEYDPSIYLLSKSKQETLKDLITAARDYFESTLKVQRLFSLQLRSKCKNSEGLNLGGVTYCQDDCAKRCGDARASKEAQYFSECVCNGPCETEQGNWGGVLRNADFVFFVSVDGRKCDQRTMAFASHCAYDEYSRRPVAGFVNICPLAFNHMKAKDLSKWEAVIKHELIHALVFSRVLFSTFQGILRYTERVGHMVLVSGVTERFRRLDWETATGIVSHDVFMVVTPKVREEARKYFNCPDLEGAELEDQGGAGTAGVHWEKRVLENEAMSGVTTQVYALSRITLALFEDSGWYEVNYDKAEPMSFGRGLGCGFAKQSCLTWIRRNAHNPYPFCNVLDDSRCSGNRKAKVRCNLMTGLKNVFSHYDYNIRNVYRDKKGRPIHGHGDLSISDYCPYYKEYGEYSSEGKHADTRCTIPENMMYNNYSLEIFSPSARCFDLDDGITIENEIEKTTWLHSVGCYEAICENNLVFIKTQKSKFYPCYKKGQLIHVKKRLIGIGTVSTRIVCPSCTELCGRENCSPERAVWMLTFFLLANLFSPLHACDYRPPTDDEISTAITEYPDGRRPKRDIPLWDWIRIETVYDQTFYLLTEERQKTLVELIVNARDYFESTIMVQRLSSIQLPPSCKMKKHRTVNNTVTQCKYDCEKRCGRALAPTTAKFFSECKCVEGPCETNQTDWGGKLTNADFILFVSLNEDGCARTVLAFGSHCSIDPYTQRPVAGFVNICPYSFTNMKNYEINQWEATLKHELIHAFVFSGSLYPKFKGAKGGPKRQGRMVLVPGVLERFERKNWETAKGMVSHEVFMMVTPKVREEARKFFGCPDLEGAEIESQGGAGTAGVHWEKRVFENEAMSGISTQVHALSRLTLALFEDSGWYRANYDKAEEMSWGRNLGCRFAKQSCLTWMRTHLRDTYPYCNVLDDTRCSHGRKAKVRCNLFAGTNQIPPEFDYNIKNLYRNSTGHSIWGYGHVAAADFCPYYRVFGDISKEDSDTRCTLPDNMNYNNYSLEIFSPLSRCFELDDGIRIENERGATKWLHTVGCYENSMISRGYVARPRVADRGLIAGQNRPCACPETRVDSGDGLPVSAKPGLTHDIVVSRTSVRPKACNQMTGRCKGGGLESPPTNRLHMPTPGERNRKEPPDSGGKPGTVAPGRTGLQKSYRLPKWKRTRMTICTYNARTLASEAAIEHLMMLKIKYDVIGLTETRRRHPLHAVYETGEELFLGTCDSRGVGGVGVLVNTRTAKNDISTSKLAQEERLRNFTSGPTAYNGMTRRRGSPSSS